MRRRSMSSGMALSLILLTACGSAVEGTDADSDVTTSAVDNFGDLRYTCGGTAFDPARLEGPGDLEHSETALGDALRKILKTPDGTMGGEGWRIVHEKGNKVDVAAPSPNNEHPYVHAVFRRSKGDWKPVNWGDCLPMAVVGERSPALWELETEPSDDATQLQLMVEESACSSGRELTEDNTRADIEYSQDVVVILMSADSLKAGKNVGFTCIGVPPAAITIELEEPVGDRQLVDAGSYPPTQRDS